MAGLAAVPVRERVVEVKAVFESSSSVRYRYGSGFRLGGRLVLTAAHVVTGNAVGITVRGPDKAALPARLLDMPADGPGMVDLALLELGDETVELPPVAMAKVDRDAPVPAPVEGCWAVGYPLFQEVESAARGVNVRETAQVLGRIHPAENLVSGLLSLQVTSTPRALPAGGSQWAGMSGAAVLAGDRLIGVVSEHAPGRGESAITVTPLSSLDRLPAAAAARWWACLDADPRRLIRLPAREERAAPAYRATLRELRARAGVLQDRDDELEAIRAFATGQPSALGPLGQQYAWLAGDAWAGKTALLAEAVHALPPEVDCVAYFLARAGNDADRQRFVAAIVPQLTWLLDEEPPPAPDEHVFRQLWQRAAQRAADEDRHLLLVIDGLDEDQRPGGHSVAGWLPGDTVPGLPARVLISSRPSLSLPGDVDPAHPLARFTPGKRYLLAGSPHAERQRELARQEIDRLLRQASGDLVLDALGLLTAARGGPLALDDFAALTRSRRWQVRQALDDHAGKTLLRTGPEDMPRYAFAHQTLLERCQQEDVGGAAEERRIRAWAAEWRRRGWPAASEGGQGTPLYLLDNYPQMLHGDRADLAELAGDAGWVTAVVESLGVDAVLAALRTADDVAPGEPRLAAMQTVVRKQAHYLRGWETVADPAFVPRQLCLQAAELSEDVLAAGYRARQLTCADPGPVLQWTTKRVSQALALELAFDQRLVRAVAVLPDGRVVTCASGFGGVLVWNPSEPDKPPVELSGGEWMNAVAVLPDGRVAAGSARGHVRIWDLADPASPTELGCRKQWVDAMAVLPGGRMIISGHAGGNKAYGRVLVWDPARPGAAPMQLRRRKHRVNAMAVLSDGRVVTAGGNAAGGLVLTWDPADPGAAPVRLGRHESWVTAVAVLADGRVVAGLSDFAAPDRIEGDRVGRVLVWDPADPSGIPVEIGRHDDSGVTAVAVLRDGRVAAVFDIASGGCKVLVCDPARPGAAPVEIGRYESSVTGAAVLPDGRVVTGAANGRLVVWDLAQPDAARVDPGRRADKVTAMTTLPDGRLVTGSGGNRRDGGGGQVLVWDPAHPGAGPVELGRRKSGVNTAAVLPDGRVITGLIGQDEGGMMLVWDPAHPGAAPVELGSHGDGLSAVAVLPDGRVITGGTRRHRRGGYGSDGRMLVWDTAHPGAAPVELGRYGDWLSAVAVLPDGRVVTCDSNCESEAAAVRDPAHPGAAPVELEYHVAAGASAVALLPDGRVIAGVGATHDRDEMLLILNPAHPAAVPAEFGRPGADVSAMAVLPDGRLVTGSGRRVQLWPAQGGSPGSQLFCPVNVFAASRLPSGGTRLFIGHEGDGISCWEISPAP